jgi:hypothetical protein
MVAPPPRIVDAIACAPAGTRLVMAPVSSSIPHTPEGAHQRSLPPDCDSPPRDPHPHPSSLRGPPR